MKRKKFPFPLSGCGGTDMLEKFVRNKQSGHYVKKILSFFFTEFFIKKHRRDYNCNKNRGYKKMDGAEMGKIDIIRVEFVHC